MKIEKQRSKKLTKLNTADTYILVDVKGWLKSNDANELLLKTHNNLESGFKLTHIETYNSDYGDGYINGDLIIDSEKEFEFFELKMVRHVILVSGKKRAGKNYVSDELKVYLEKLDYSVDLYAYADPMKRILCTTFGITLDELDYMKNEKLPIALATGTGYKTINMREILQRFGTEAMQTEFGVCVWKERAEDFIKKSKADIVIITDFRFPTEIIDDAYSIKVKNIDVENADTDTHISENLLGDFEFSFEIDNTGKPTSEQLQIQFKNIC